jgi:hypothetical protein
MLASAFMDLIKDDAMIFKQFLYHDTGCAAYVFG